MHAHIKNGCYGPCYLVVYVCRNDSHAKEDVVPSCELTLKNLQLDYLDLYLIHWPQPLKKGTKLATAADEEKLGYTGERMDETWKVHLKSLVRR